MWDKIGKLAMQAGKIYIEKRGVDGVIEDASKVYNFTKKKVSNVSNRFSSNNNVPEIEEEDDYGYENGLNYEFLDDYISNILPEMESNLESSKNLEVLSAEFYVNVKTALEIGYNAISDLFELEDEISEQDFSILIDNYINPIDSVCDKLLMLIKQKCRGSEKSPIEVNKDDIKKPFGMEVHGIYPINFDTSNTLLVGVIRTGRIKKDDIIVLDKENDICAQVSYVCMFDTTLEQAEAGDVCCVSLLGNYIDILPEKGTFFIGKKTEDKESVQKENILTDKEQEYAEEIKAFFADDGEISDRERRLLNRLRESLGISEERAAELEALCNPNVLSKEEQEYADEVKVVLEDGVISDRERRLLNSLAKSLNISPERALQIEESLK